MARLSCGLIFACALLVPTSSLACWVGPYDALIHSDVPDRLPSGLVVLEVDIRDQPEQDLYGPGLIADVRRVWQGLPTGVQTVVLRTTAGPTCESPYENGRRGLVVGFLRGEVSGAPWIEPQFAPGANGYRLDAGVMTRGATAPMTPSPGSAERSDPAREDR